jgi:hypothetical protein
MPEGSTSSICAPGSQEFISDLSAGDSFSSRILPGIRDRLAITTTLTSLSMVRVPLGETANNKPLDHDSNHKQSVKVDNFTKRGALARALYKSIVSEPNQTKIEEALGPVGI